MESTLIGSTTVSATWNAPKSSVKQRSSVVHVLVNARGKNAISTFFPRSDESVTSLPAVDGRVKSGAGEPTAGMVGRVALAVTASPPARISAPTSVQFTTFHQAVT